MPNETVSITAVVISLGSLVVASVAAYISWKNAQYQGQLTQRLKAQDQDFERKRFVTALWDKMANIPEIHPDKNGEYDEADVFDALNTLELVAICWQNTIVDQNIVFLVFGKSYNKRVQEILGIRSPLPILRKSGIELLQDRQVILNVNKYIEARIANQAS